MTALELNQMRLYFVTYNVATKFPEEDPRQMLGINSNNPEGLPDLFVVGLQEVKSQPHNMVIDMLFEDPWTKIFKESLKTCDYIKIRTQRLQGLVLNVFCLRKHLTRLRFIEATYTRTGLGGMWGNKGAVSVRFNMYGVKICIVNTHLTPHDHLCNDRIADYNTILREHAFQVPETQHVLYHDYIFWIGDLNFRLNGEDLTAELIDKLVAKNQLKLLLSRDQLNIAKESGDAFAEFSEADIAFPPTYKFEFSSQEYDLKRRPSWTDRILYKVNADVYEDVKLEAVKSNYRSHPSYVGSDHKPVSAEFTIKIRPDYEDHGVEFQPVSAWIVDQQNSVGYTLRGDFIPSPGDWIGLFHDGFSSLDEYLVYEYVGRGKPGLETFSVATNNTITERIYFSDSALKAPGMYRLVYVCQSGDIVGVLGMSPPFPGHRRT
ncbi:inositol polyphosphate 5-phosphatase K-like [Diachasmimorpha longicaudata]|uniref:inositol polyphosphate 5-phosphatase K-like n=1 Tax=Diachasmimorpha longicaudata TaxID=58733 RepID=UPI0030B9017C